MTESGAAAARPGTDRAWRWLAWIWLAVVLALAVQQAGFWRQPAIDTDVMALLPGSDSDARLSAANQRLSDAVTGEIVVLLSGNDWSRTQAAAQAFLADIARGDALRAAATDDAEAVAGAIAFYAPHRQGLLTPEQRAWLRQATPEAITDMATLGVGSLMQVATEKRSPTTVWLPTVAQTALLPASNLRQTLAAKAKPRIR